MENQESESPASADAQAGPNLLRLRLTHPHPLISKAVFKRDARNERGHSLSNDYDGIDIRVSREKFRLALAILDRLFKALEKDGLSIRSEQPQYGNQRGTYAFSGHYDKCQLYIEEEFRRVDHVPTAKEKAEQARYSFSKPPRWDFIPTGALSLHPGGTVDLTSQPAVDDLITRSVAAIKREIDRERASRVAREEEQHQEAQRRQREEDEKRRVDALFKSADELHRYRLLMAYIEEVRQFKRIPGNQLREGQTLAEWLRWAEAQAKAIHPLGH